MPQTSGVIYKMVDMALSINIKFMNKIMSFVAVVLLLPLMVLAAGEAVSIIGVSLDHNTATITGTLDLGTETEGNVYVDNSLLQAITNPNWSVSTHVNFGNHVAKAVVGVEESTMNFTVVNPDGGGSNPCMSMGTCPFFGLKAPFIPIQDSSPVLSSVLPVKTNNIAKDGTLVTIQNLFELIGKGLI